MKTTELLKRYAEGERDFSEADLSGADLSRANLRGANLSEADLSRANLRGADLSEADLSAIQSDVEAVLATAPHEAAGLLAALCAGHVDGSVYEGMCACLVGTIANLRGENYAHMTCDLLPDAERPAERWFLAIRSGDTPENHQICAITVEWIRAWIVAHPAETTAETATESEKNA